MAVSSLAFAAWMVGALHAQALSNARPPECAAPSGPQSGNVWERAKSPALRKYCDLVASGASKLAGSATMVNEVLSIADEADRMSPGHAAPAVLRGRAFAKMGRWIEAYNAMRLARTRDLRALDDALALLAWGRVATRTGHIDEAREAYRALLPRAATLLLADRGPAYVEAGFLAMSRGPSGLEEAVAVFRQARRDAQDTAQTVAILALALALDRAGAREEARAVLSERPHADPWTTLSDARTRQLLAPQSGEGETEALAALALEGLDPVRARLAWLKYAEHDFTGPWAEHARARAGALAGKRAGKPR